MRDVPSRSPLPGLEGIDLRSARGPWGSRFRGRRLAALCSLTLLAALAGAKEVQAQVVTPFTVRFTTNARGNITAA